MKVLKILHLASDEKFIDQAVKEFERAAPGANDLYVYGKEPLKLIKSPATVVTEAQALGGSLSKAFSSYDLVVLHSLDIRWFRTIRKLPLKIPVVWLGWGYDYYDILYRSKKSMLLPLTESAWLSMQQGNSVVKTIKRGVKALLVPSKKSVIERIDFFSPVLTREYEMVKKASRHFKFPRQVVWNYGNLEEDLVNGFENETVDGNSVLVGNSATVENNHLDAFSLLSELGVKGRKIISPLSYGDPSYRKLVLNAGALRFGEDFMPLVDFMSISEYVGVLKSCGFVVMDHLRQQAVGNIIIMLYLGAKVFLQKDCPTFAFFKEQGAVIFSIQELQQSPEMLNELLGQESVSVNRSIVVANWSKEVSGKKTRDLLQQACNI